MGNPLYAQVEQVNQQQGKTKQEWINEFISEGMKQAKANNYFKEITNNGALVKLEPQYRVKC